MSKITAYTALTSPQPDDVTPVVDVSDTSMAATGTTKKTTLAGVLAGGLAVQVLRPSGGDDTSQFTAALAALPTTTIYANPGTQSGTTAVVPYGTIVLSAGTFKTGQSGDIGNFGPLVNLTGQGRNATTIAYYGAGDCLRFYNPVRPASDTLDNLGYWHGRIDGLTIDGSNAQAGAVGLHYGDTEGGTLGPDLMIRDFPQGTLTGLPTLSLGTTNSSGGTFAAGTYFWVVTAITRTGETVKSNTVTTTLALNGTQVLNWTAVTGAAGYHIYRGPGTAGTPNTYVAQAGAVTTWTDTGTSIGGSCPPAVNTSGNIGLHLDNTVSWTENIWARVTIKNCANAVVMTGADGVTDVSFEYNDLTFKIYGMAPNQNGIVLRNGAFYANGSLKMRANFADGPSVMSSAALALVGASAGAFSLIGNSHLDIQAETNTPLAGGGANGPMTISFSDPNHNQITGCAGILSFLNFGSAWVTSSYGSSTVRTGFIFDGIVQGDTALNPANAPNPTGIGARILSTGLATSAFQPLCSGDVFALTLTGNTTLLLASSQAPCVAGPQRKTLVITQAAGGGFTVTWPKPGSPSLTAPAVYWPGGTAPTMSAGASAVDTYTLVTIDGIRWYGTAAQANS
jgi:hypothetical protein